VKYFLLPASHHLRGRQPLTNLGHPLSGAWPCCLDKRVRMMMAAQQPGPLFSSSAAGFFARGRLAACLHEWH
jgi:hypothetical protein